MSEWAAKRFWTSVDVANTDAGWGVTLDGRGVRTPAKSALVLPTEALARAVASEWEAQEDVIDPGTMPYTRMANSAIDKVTSQFDDVVAYVAAYGETDLLCYRSDGPDGLVRRQTEIWDPILDWAEATYGARLAVTAGVMPVAQDPVALERLKNAVADHSAFQLAALHDLVALSGSLILGLAAARNLKKPEHLFKVSRLDEDHQIQQWGEDEEAAANAEKRRKDFLHAADFFQIA